MPPPYILPTSQSAISEVRDQLSLDFADGKYLNVISSNLGLQRPPFGFNDATWRALVRVLALQYKQVSTKFEQVLSIVLGPKITQCGALAENAEPGATYAVLVNTDQFPQVGTMVIDAGLITEETVDYTFIDRYTNVVYFASPLVNSHTAVGQVWETGIVSPVAAAASYLNVYDASGFKSLGSQYTICIGRGTPYEFSGPITSLNLDARKLGISFPPLGAPGATAVAGIQIVQDAGPSEINAHYLRMVDVQKLLIENGYLQSANISSVSFVATGGSTTSVGVTGPLSVNRYGGFWILFTGNITAALTDAIAYVEDNTATTFTFANTLAAAPVAGDTFSVISNFQYIRASESDNSVLAKRELPDLLRFPLNCQFTVMRPAATVAIAQVQVKGAGWDVIQSDPDRVEILLPDEMLANNLRSASYIRETGLLGTTTANAIRNFGDTDISLTNATQLPLIGVMNHVPSSNRYLYYNPHTWLTAEAAAGATTLSVVDTSQFLPTGTIDCGAFSVTYTVTDATTLTTAPLPAAIQLPQLIRESFIIRLAKGLLNGVGLADTVQFYANYDVGDLWNVANVWPGPYVWDFFADTRKNVATADSSTQVLAGPSVLSVDRLVNATVFEVADASAFPTAVPYDVAVGENSGNVETLAVQQLSLKSRTYQNTTAVVNIGDTQITLASISGPLGPAHQFPNGGPYRIVIEPFTANQEVLEVISTNGVNILNLSGAAAALHPIGSRVALLSDLIRVSPAAGDDHTGKVKYTDRFGFYANESQPELADTVRPIYTQVTLALGGATFSNTSANALINFGNEVLPAKSTLIVGASQLGPTNLLTANALTGATQIQPTSTAAFPNVFPYFVRLVDGATNETILVTSKDATFLYTGTAVVNNYFVGVATVQLAATPITLVDSKDFPTTGYPYVISLDYGAGPLLEEYLHVTNNNIVTGVLTVSHAPLFFHGAGKTVKFKPGAAETISYTSRVGADLNFSPNLSIQNTHYLMELFAPSVGSSFPRENGFDFPLRLPVTAEDRIRFVIDLVRAAGVEVTFISKR